MNENLENINGLSIDGWRIVKATLQTIKETKRELLEVMDCECNIMTGYDCGRCTRLKELEEE